jgi:hypothetical protein
MLPKKKPVGMPGAAVAGGNGGNVVDNIKKLE